MSGDNHNQADEVYLCGGKRGVPVGDGEHGQTDALARHLADAAPNGLCWEDLGPIGQSAWRDVARSMLDERIRGEVSS